MATGEIHNYVLIAAFQRGGIGASVADVARDLGLEFSQVTDLVGAIYHQGFLENDGSGGSIVFEPSQRQEVREIEARYLEEARTLASEQKQIILELARYGRLNGQAIADGLAMVPNVAQAALNSLASRQLIHYPYIGPFGLGQTEAKIETKGRFFAVILNKMPAASPIDPENIVIDMTTRPAAGEDRVSVLKAVAEVAKPIASIPADEIAGKYSQPTDHSEEVGLITLRGIDVAQRQILIQLHDKNEELVENLARACSFPATEAMTVLGPLFKRKAIRKSFKAGNHVRLTRYGKILAALAVEWRTSGPQDILVGEASFEQQERWLLTVAKEIAPNPQLPVDYGSLAPVTDLTGEELVAIVRRLSKKGLIKEEGRSSFVMTDEGRAFLHAPSKPITPHSSGVDPHKPPLTRANAVKSHTAARQEHPEDPDWVRSLKKAVAVAIAAVKTYFTAPDGDPSTDSQRAARPTDGEHAPGNSKSPSPDQPNPPSASAKDVPRPIAKTVAGVVAVASAAALISSHFTSPRIAVLAIAGMIVAMLLMLVIQRAVGAVTKSDAIFYDILVKLLVGFAVLYFIALMIFLFPSILSWLRATTAAAGQVIRVPSSVLNSY